MQLPQPRIRAIFALLPLLLAVHTHASPLPPLENLDELIHALPVESLKEVLIGHVARYQDGVFESEENALHRIREGDPELATRLVGMAKQSVLEGRHLLKRQNGTESITTSASLSSITSPVIVTDSSTTAVSFTTESTAASDTTSASSSQQTSKSDQTPSTVAETTTNSKGSPTTKSEIASETIAASSPITASTLSGGSTASTPATKTGVLIPIVQSSTAKDGSVVVTTTSAFATQAQTTAAVAVTSTNSAGDVVTTSTSVPAAVLTGTRSNGDAFTTTSALQSVEVDNSGKIVKSSPAPTSGPSAVSSTATSSSSGPTITTTNSDGASVTLTGATPGAVLTATDAKGKVFVTTITPSSGDSVSEVIFETTRLANGLQSTVTSFQIVGGGQRATEGDSSPSSTTSVGAPSLQKNVAAPTGRPLREVAAVLGGAIGVAVFL